MNWGNKILVVFVAFAIFIFYLVYRCTQTQVDLVSKDYYKDELAYQDVIDGRNNVAALTGKVNISQKEDNLVIQLPHEMNGKKIEGLIWFYAPADAQKDKKIELQVNDSSQQVIDKKMLHSGNYTVKISWEAANNKYYNEQPLMIQ